MNSIPRIDPAELLQSIAGYWRDSILDRLAAYIRIPNMSPLFDPQWESHGHMEAAVNLMADWCRAQPIAGMRVEVRRLPGLTPLLTVEVPGELAGSVLLYGHLDKQPEFTGWEPELGPWSPVIRDGKLYGRGGADDGYAVFSSLAAILALKARGVALPNCLLMIEASEESGSIHLGAHLDALGAGLATPSLVICLDAECGNYAQLWSTTSLRGNLVGRLHVRVLNEGVHSGMASGIAPTAFRILEQLLARLENPLTGDLLLDELQAAIPKDRRAQLAIAARVLGPAVAEKVPFAQGVRALSNDPLELLINSTWRATLAVTGADGLPAVQSAGNVLLPEISLKLSLRLPPPCDATRAEAAVRRALERDPPYGAQVEFESEEPTGGWNAPPLAPWLERSMGAASQALFGRDAVHVGSGGTIPFMGVLGERFPQTQFFVTGVLGPQANAHGPNEFLHIDYARRLTACVALVLADFAAQA
jgi:acetylornithine deacetylase/succinyl-diaminopimelate desuccinylase-like protein